MHLNVSAVDAWIDVGGTFTDCFVRAPGGELSRCKVLSSGRVPVSVERVDADAPSVVGLQASNLSQDPAHFWTGADLVVLDQEGQELGRTTVRGFTAGVLTLEPADAVPADLWRRAGEHAFRYELDAGLEAPVLGVRRLLACPLHASLPDLRVRLGTTRGTNALLTRTGAKTALAVTAPFTDLLAIGDQTRPDLFALNIQKPHMLADFVVPIAERLAADGGVLQALDAQQARTELASARAAGCQSLAICLMHSYRNPEHERQLAQLAQELGFEYISLSSHLAPLIGWVVRAQTTVVDAYLSPIIRGYLRSLVNQFQGTRGSVSLHVMTSAGGLVHWQDYSGKDSILSGPAGGVRALRELGRVTDCGELIGLDMGGTSTDVCRVTAENTLQYESTKAGVRILTPTLPIETVAAGGGSICWFDGVSFRVGPQSASSSPGPACYGRGGPLTVTDLNVFLGRVPASQFPFDVDFTAIERRLRELQTACAPVVGQRSLEDLAAGFRRLAATQMAEAVRSVTIAQGTDPRSHTLVGFGGAAGQHICEVAELLGLTRILDSASAGLFSALGMGIAEQRLDDVLPVYRELSHQDLRELDLRTQPSRQRLQRALVEQGAAPDHLVTGAELELRYAGSDATLCIPWDGPTAFDPHALAMAFHQRHAQVLGHRREDQPVEIVSVRMHSETPGVYRFPSSYPVEKTRQLRNSNHPGIWQRVELQPGSCLLGPATVCNAGSTLVIDAGWEGRVASDGLLYLTRRSQASPSEKPARASILHPSPPTSDADEAVDTGPQTNSFDPIYRDCYAARLMAIATQMGLVLEQTSVSVNVKRRRDFSCAVFDASGHLLANAPHVPVHLGAMGQTVRAVLGEFPGRQPGDHFITNDPYRGGSHLPDITVVTPVYSETGQLSFVVANRAHHADVGGIVPGSMSVNATRLSEEGVLIEPLRVAVPPSDASDTLHNALQPLQELLSSATHPPRNIDENLADIAAQMAANRRGAELLAQYACQDGWQALRDYAEHLLAAADQRVRQFIELLAIDTPSFADALDDGSPIQVRFSKPQTSRLRISFEGTAGVHPRNFNANPSIVTAAVLYVLRCLIADDMPLNEGALRSIDLEIPPGLLHPPVTAAGSDRPAVAAGNVETSQRVVDVLLGALGVAAASQGTMNNLLFGNDQFGFYETICGGAGANASAAGASAVHTHMTNTRLTDPEVLESNYPIRLTEFGIRPHSGGQGQFSGGDGVIREIEFLAPVTCSLLTSRRAPYAPFGLRGGLPGRSGRNWFVHQQLCSLLPACCQFDAPAGSRLRLETPGGGGFGAP